MGLETGTYPSDFVLTNPTAGDPKAQGDDHLRLIKTCVQNALPIGAANYPLTLETSVSASGTSVDFTSIPSWVRRITLMISGLSTNGTSIPLVQIGDSGGVEATNYLGSVDSIQNAAATQTLAFSTGFTISTAMTAASVLNGIVQLVLLNSVTNTWVVSIGIGSSNAAATSRGAGVKVLSAALDRVRVTTVNGTDTFDAGVVNVLYE
jgi:hypothetical protein